ncbi:hypothetical protein [Streptomyces canus]|uniref:hypothetical protein n=1 Tax=Streptomyces canus TaxID=58343 RepID=UPI002E32C8E1|nr:hypothetical protein [Streptomyces canus]
MIDVDTGSGDQLVVLVQYRMATTEQMHWVIAPGVRIEQTLRRLSRLREEGLIDRITLPQAGRRRVPHRLRLPRPGRTQGPKSGPSPVDRAR